jgi:hypothetical protein
MLGVEAWHFNIVCKSSSLNPMALWHEVMALGLDYGYIKGVPCPQSEEKKVT